MERAEAKLLNPLAIIFAFFSFTEVMLGYAVFKTTGATQVALTAFVIAFPTLAAAAFFWFLWFRPQHLYAPRDYGSDESYLKSMEEARRSRGLGELEAKIEQIVTTKLTSHELVTQLRTASDDQISQVLRTAANDVTATIRDEQFVTIDFTAFAPEIPEMSVPFDAYETVGDLTNDVYFRLAPRVKPYQYGTQWLLQDQRTGSIIKTLRMLARVPPGVALHDHRSLAEAGVGPGTRLAVIRPDRAG